MWVTHIQEVCRSSPLFGCDRRIALICRIMSVGGGPRILAASSLMAINWFCMSGVIVPVSNAISAFVSPWTTCGRIVFRRAVRHRLVYSLQTLFDAGVVMCIPWVIMALATYLIRVPISALIITKCQYINCITSCCHWC
jgi:hypothetical protein